MRYFLRKKQFFPLDLSLKRLYTNPVRIPKLRKPISGSVDRFEPQSWRSMEGLIRCSANYEPLSPIGFLERTAKVYKDKTSVVYGSVSYTWSETHQRCLKLASALVHQQGILPGDVVAILAPNIPAMYELHFAIPMAGAVLCPLNTRLDAAMVSIFLAHSEAKALFVDHQWLKLAQKSLHLLAKSNKVTKLPTLILISQPDTEDESTLPSLNSISNRFDCEYERLIESGNIEFRPKKPRSEWDPISLNYTSGTTLRPKGVVCSHRGAYVNSLATAFLPKMGASVSPVYLWTIPMFHGNGWTLTWGIAAQGGTNVCLRKISAKNIFKNIKTQNVTHMGGAPTVLNMILDEKLKLSREIEVFTGGSPPDPKILIEIEELGFNVTNVYGMTELTGPATYCETKPEWNLLPAKERSKLKARQGLKHIAIDEIEIKDPETMKNVPEDGVTKGEVMIRGNNVMLGYFKDLKATQEAFNGGWLHSGDLAVKYSDGYIEIKDRLKDLIISGGENIDPAEVEAVLCSHRAVLEAAVVARPDDHWGETPCAFVKVKFGFDLKSEEIIEFCREKLPHYMAPKTVVFSDLPRNLYGKIDKLLLRERAHELGSL